MRQLHLCLYIDGFLGIPLQQITVIQDYQYVSSSQEGNGSETYSLDTHTQGFTGLGMRIEGLDRGYTWE